MSLSHTFLSLVLILVQSLKSEFDMGLSTKNPILELFYFHRVVIDEAHELHDESLGKGRVAFLFVSPVLCRI
jgi:hypothetical protein